MNLFELQDQSQNLTQTDLDQLANYLDTIYAKNNIDFEFTRHFLDRVNDARNVKHITIDELKRMFTAAQQAYGSKMSKSGPDFEAVIRDVSTKINCPFVLNWNRHTQQLELYAKTVMRKDNFKTPDPVLPVKTESLERKLSEFKIQLESDLCRLEGLKDLGMTNPKYVTLDEDIKSMRHMLSRLTAENVETEFKSVLSEMANESENTVFKLALSRLNKIMPNRISIQDRLRAAIERSRTHNSDKLQ